MEKFLKFKLRKAEENFIEDEYLDGFSIANKKHGTRIALLKELIEDYDKYEFYLDQVKELK